MTLKTRRYIFWLFLALFILVGTGAIFYSNGWRLDLEDCSFYSMSACTSIQRTGGVFVKTQQKGISIKIDDEVFSDKSGMLQNGTLISNLLPKSYYLEIEKEGYQTWQKNVEVEPALVSKLAKVILVPNLIESQALPLANKVNSFYQSAKEETVFQNSNGLYYNQKNIPLKLRGDKFVLWNEPGDAFITFDSVKGIYYLNRLNDLSKIFNISASFNNLNKNQKIEKIIFHPADQEKLIIESNKKIYILDVTRLKLEKISEDQLFVWTVQNPNIYYIKEAETTGVYSFNLILKNETLLYGFSNEEADEILEISADNGKTGILKEKGNILIVSFQNKELEKISVSNAKNIVFSPDKRKISFTGADNKISVYLLENEVEELSKGKGEIIELGFYSDNYLRIKSTAWYKDSNHLLIEYLDPKNQLHIDFIEIDSRLPVNRYELAQGEKMSYDLQTNRLFFIQENSLHFLDLNSF